MLNSNSKSMDSKIVMFSVLVLAAIFAMALPMDTAFADVSPDGEGEYEDGNNERSCPFQDKKRATVNPGLII